MTQNSSSNETIKTPVKQALTIIGSTTSTIVSLIFFSMIAYRRDAFMISFFIGSILNGIMSKVLKKVLNQDRPAQDDGTTSTQTTLQPGDKGMPSSHAMSLGFIGVVTGLEISKYYHYYGWLVIVSYVTISLVYRVKANLHSLEQVLVGLVFGVTNGIFWRGIMHGTNPLLPSVHFMRDFVSPYLLSSDGILPIPYLIIPAIVGAVVVGSFERRISRWIKNWNESVNKDL